MSPHPWTEPWTPWTLGRSKGALWLCDFPSPINSYITPGHSVALQSDIHAETDPTLGRSKVVQGLGSRLMPRPDRSTSHGNNGPRARYDTRQLDPTHQ